MSLKVQTGFWEGEICEYCGGPIVEKKADITRKVKKQLVLIEGVPVGVCKECGTRYYSANVLKIIAENVSNRNKAKRYISVPVYSL